MKKYLLIVLVLFACSSANAQSNSSEAKAAYLLAEESYDKGDYKAALDFLLQVREALGGANCKVIYLQIMATKERYAKDSGVNRKVLPLIVEFENSPDYADFNEEKKLEVTKMKLLIKKEMKAAQEKSDAEKSIRDTENKIKADREKNIAEIANQWPPMNITLAELDSIKPEWKVKDWKTTSWSKLFDIIHPGSFSYTKSNYPFSNSKSNESDTGKVANLVLDQGRISCYCSYVIDFDGPSRQDDGSGYSAALQAMKKSTASVTEKTGIRPGGFNDFLKGGYTMSTFEWHSDLYLVMDHTRFRAKGNSGIVQLVRCVFRKNITK